MLLSLGLQKYEKNFKRGLLTDATLPLLSDRSGASYPPRHPTEKTKKIYEPTHI
jgi:hypothetical protein